MSLMTLQFLSDMFWNKKDEEIEKLNRTILENVSNYNRNNVCFESQINLILNHLKLKYVPEIETKEPAKLVEKTDLTDLMCALKDLNNSYSYVTGEPPPTKPKKKAKPKKK